MSIKDFNDAKRLIDLPELLKSLGYEFDAKKSRAGDIWYKSPFRPEDEPSFHIQQGRKGFWLWKDFGGEGGTVIDFIMKLKGFNNPKQALDFLKEWYDGKPVQPSLKIEQLNRHCPNPEPTLKLKKARALKLKDRFQIAYAKSRGIKPELACQTLKHITYRNTKLGKDFFAVGIPNLSDGYEIRSGKGFKSCLGNKDISVIEGQSNNIMVFEGMFDYLSLLTLENKIENQILILNSSSLVHRAIEYIHQSECEKVELYLDNDSAGRKASLKIKDEFSQSRIEVIDHNDMYEAYEDLNDYLLAEFKPLDLK
ncbi:MAG: toprim domain-containing protein [Crocinitomicaceae bacterium]